MITSELTAEFDCSCDQLYSIIIDCTNYSWRSDIKKIDIVDPGVRFIEYTSKDFPTLFTVTKRKKNQLYAFKMENNNLKGRWYGKFQETGSHTTLTLTEEIELKRPILRLLAKAYLKRQQKRYVHDLRKYVETPEF